MMEPITLSRWRTASERAEVLWSQSCTLSDRFSCARWLAVGVSGPCKNIMLNLCKSGEVARALGFWLATDLAAQSALYVVRSGMKPSQAGQELV